jgi:hypothetical protein
MGLDEENMEMYFEHFTALETKTVKVTDKVKIKTFFELFVLCSRCMGVNS